MAITLELKQQQVVKSSAYIVVHWISAVGGVTESVLQDNLKKVFLIQPTVDGGETLVRVCSAQDYLTYQAYPSVPAAILGLWLSEDLVGVTPDNYKLYFNVTSDVSMSDRVEIWDTTHNGAPTPTTEWPCSVATDESSVALLTPGTRLPSVAPGGAPVAFQLRTLADAPVVTGYGQAARTYLYTHSRDDVIYTFHGSAAAAEDSTRAVQTAVKALVAELNKASDDFDELFTSVY